ncbi:unnamed protein product, partial [marine sediment metagenome]
EQRSRLGQNEEEFYQGMLKDKNDLSVLQDEIIKLDVMSRFIKAALPEQRRAVTAEFEKSQEERRKTETTSKEKPTEIKKRPDVQA